MDIDRQTADYCSTLITLVTVSVNVIVNVCIFLNAVAGVD